MNSSTYSAEYGRNPGGQFAFETKSGTNQWHGTAYDYFRNGFFDAQDWFNDYFQSRNPPFARMISAARWAGRSRSPPISTERTKRSSLSPMRGCASLRHSQRRQLRAGCCPAVRVLLPRSTRF